MDEDGLLLRRFVKDRSQAAFEALVRRHVDLVYGVGLRMTRNPHRAEDITQTVFTELSRKARSLCDRKSLAGWLCLSAVYASKLLVRTEARRSVRERAADFPDPATDESVDSAVLEPILDGALERLKTADREAIVLRFFKNLSFAEVGTRLGVSENAARMRVQRGIEHLRGILSRRGIVSTATAIELAMEAQAAVAAPGGLALQIASGGLVATAGGSALAGVLSFMSATKITLAGCSLALLAALAGYYHEHTLWMSDEVAMVALQQKEATTERMLRQAQAMNQSVAPPSKTGSRTLSAATNAGMPAAIAAALASKEYAPTPGQLQEAHDRYDPLLKRWGLTPEQMDRFAYLMVEKELARKEVQAAIRAAGLTVTPAVTQLREEATQPYWDEMRAMVTPQLWGQFFSYEVSSGIQIGYVTEIQMMASTSGDPLSADQARALGNVIAANMHPVNTDPSSLSTENGIDWEAVVQQAAPTLSASQLIALQNYAQRKTASRH